MVLTDEARLALALSLMTHLNKLSKTCWFWIGMVMCCNTLTASAYEATLFRLLGLVAIAIHSPMSPKRSLLVTICWGAWETEGFYLGLGSTFYMLVLFLLGLAAARRMFLLAIT